MENSWLQVFSVYKEKIALNYSVNVSVVRDFSILEVIEYMIAVIIVWQIDQQLADNVKENARRYKKIFEDAVYDMLPDYKEHDVSSISFWFKLFMWEKMKLKWPYNVTWTNLTGNSVMKYPGS